MAETKQGTLVVLSGPSGVGKSTLVSRALEAMPELAFSVSVTTRPPRPTERDGVDYRFVDEEAFEALAARGGLLERAVVHGRHYGTPRDAVHDLQALGRTVLLDIDTQGADQVRESGEPATFVFVLPPDADTLEARLKLRGTEDPAAMTLRLSRARAEMERAGDYEFVVVNDDLERAARDLIAVLRAAVIRARRDQTVRGVIA